MTDTKVIIDYDEYQELKNFKEKIIKGEGLCKIETFDKYYIEVCYIGKEDFIKEYKEDIEEKNKYLKELNKYYEILLEENQELTTQLKEEKNQKKSKKKWWKVFNK